MAFMHGSNRALQEALIEAGIADDKTRRVVLDVPVDGVVVAYVERFTDERILKVATALGGVEIRREDQS